MADLLEFAAKFAVSPPHGMARARTRKLVPKEMANVPDTVNSGRRLRVMQLKDPLMRTTARSTTAAALGGCAAHYREHRTRF